MLTFAAERGHLVTLVDGFPDEEFLPESDDRFYSAQRDVQITFLKDDDGRGRRIPLEGGRPGAEGAAHRPAVPFPETADRSRPGEDGEGRRRAEGPRAGREGARRFALAHPRRTRGFRDWRSRPDLAGLQSIRSSRSRTSSAREIERHKGEVSRILHYRLVTDKADRGLLIHLTADGLITDYDIVED